MKHPALIVTLVIASGFAAAGVPTSEQPRAANQNQAAPAPKVSSEFQPEIARLARERLTLKEAFECDLAPDSHHLVAIFQRRNARPEEALQAYEFRIIESDGRTAKTVFRRPDFNFSFPQSLPLPNGSDINGDGIKEVIVESSSGGNCWACNPSEIYQLRNHKVQLIAAGPMEIKDLNGDGILDLIVTDTRWEGYDDFSHARAPASTIVYTWKSGRYVYASADFRQFYEKEIARLRLAIDEARNRPAADYFEEDYLQPAVSLAITSAHAGDPERGVKELETLLKLNAKSAEQARHRAEILDDFRRGESSKKLREMKYGDPMPLN